MVKRVLIFWWPMSNDIYREYLDYDPDTGIILWKKQASSKALVGQEAGTVHPRGYIQIKLKGEQKQCHVVAWFLHHGEWPDGQIDHINGIKIDNRISNLRVVTSRENQQNRSEHRDGRLVGARPLGKKWQSQIQVGGKDYHLGMFPTEQEAHETYMRVCNADDMLTEVLKIRTESMVAYVKN